MTVLLFKLNGVPDDEANEVRALLDQHGIEYYETTSGNWRISLAAIWLRNDDQYQKAKDIIAEYQVGREQSARLEFDKSNAKGEIKPFVERARQEPIRYFLYLLVILIVIYLSTIPFFYFTQWLGRS